MHSGRVLPNLDDSLTKDSLLASGWADVIPPREALFDLWIDASEGDNRNDDPALANVLHDLRERLGRWMRETDDPLLHGPVLPAEGTFFNTIDHVSASDPTTPQKLRSETLSRRVQNSSTGSG